MEFQRTPRDQSRFYCKGTNLRLAIDQIPYGEFSLLYNVRPYSDGSLAVRQGLTLLSNAWSSDVNSILRFTDSNPDTSVGACRFVGTGAGNLYVADTGSPITTVNLVDNGFSGNPLSLIPMRPVGSSSAALYIGDFNQMEEVFFRPGDTLASMAVYQIGLPVPNGDGGTMTIPEPSSSGGNLNGTYWWRFAQRNVYTGKRSNPSAPTRQAITPDPVYASAGLSAGLALVAQAAEMTLPNQTAGGSSFEADTIVDIYRFGGTVFEWKLVASGNPGDTFVDDIPDIDILSAPSFPLDVNGNPALFQPFPSIDIYRSGNLTFAQSTQGGSISADTSTDPAVLTSAGHGLNDGFVVTISGYTGDWAAANGVWPATVLTANTFSIPLDASSFSASAGTPVFTWDGPVVITISGGPPAGNFESYPPGTEILVDAGSSSASVHLYRWAVSGTVAEIQEAIPAGLSAGPTYAFRIPSAIMVNQTLPHLWGPWQPSGGPIFMLGCGDPRNPGTVYWTNGNDPDSAALTNSSEVTSPSEPLVNGIIFDGRCYVWSTQRMFEGIPDPSQDGNFLWRQIPNAGGLYAPWGLVDCGAYMAYIGYDGIYKSQGVNSESLTDEQLYPIFAHDSEPGQAVVRGGITLNPPDPTALQKWRLSWQYGELYFDYPETTSGINRAWLRGTRPGTDRGWILDDYGFDGSTCRYSEVTPSPASLNSGVSDTLIGIGSSLYQFTGVGDAGFAVNYIIETPLDDAGDNRAQKYWGDGQLTYVTNTASASGATLTLLGDPMNGGQPTGFTGFIGVTITAATQGIQTYQLVAPNQLNRTLGIRISGSALTFQPEFYGWEKSWVPKPVDSPGRIDDWTDDGKATNKYLMGCIIEGDTATSSGTDLVADSTLQAVTSASRPFVSGDVGSWLVIKSGTNWVPGAYLILSVVGVVATLDHQCAHVSGSTAGVWSLGTPKTFQVQGDGGFVGATIVVSHPGQSEFPYSWTPFETHEMRLVPTATTGSWKEFKITWIWDDYPEFSAGIEDFIKLPVPQYIRGFELEVSTKSVPVVYQFQIDQGVVAATPTVNTPVRDIVVYGFSVPVIASEVRVVPLTPWEKFSLRLISDSYPDYGPVPTSILSVANGKTGWVRELILPIDTGGTAKSVKIYKDSGVEVTPALSVSVNGKAYLPFAFNPPVLTHTMQLIPQAPMRIWQDEIVWTLDVYPELDSRQTATKRFKEGGCRFVQGLRLTADTNDVPVVFEIYADGNQFIGSVTGAFNGKQTIAFPRVNEFAPFFAHDAHIIPQGRARIFEDELEWISEPAPDLGTAWTTPSLTAGFRNWWSTRFIWLAYAGAASDVIITVTLDGGAVETYTFPASGAGYLRTFLNARPTKSKYRSYRVSSASAFRLYLQDSYVEAKEWGRPYDEYTPIHVFGDASIESGARI